MNTDLVFWWIGFGFSVSLAVAAILALLALAAVAMGGVADLLYDKGVLLCGNVRGMVNIVQWIRAGGPAVPQYPQRSGFIDRTEPKATPDVE